MTKLQYTTLSQIHWIPSFSLDVFTLCMCMYVYVYVCVFIYTPKKEDDDNCQNHKSYHSNNSYMHAGMLISCMRFNKAYDMILCIIIILCYIFICTCLFQVHQVLYSSQVKPCRSDIMYRIIASILAFSLQQSCFHI